MQKRQIRFIALGFLLLFSATLIEAGLHSFVHHADTHFEHETARHACQHHQAAPNLPGLAFENSEDDCALCAHLLTYQNFALHQYAEGFTPFSDLVDVWFQSPYTGNTDLPQRPLRGPPSA